MPATASAAVLLCMWALALSDDASARELAARIRDGDREAFRAFFDAHHGRLLGYLQSRGVPVGAAEDIVQNAFVYLWTHRDRIDPDRSLRAYLFRIGTTRALNHVRDASKHAPDAAPEDARPSDAPSPEADALTAELRAQLDAAIADLPERRRMVFELCVLQDCTYREAADALSITRKTVENHMRLALRDLREALASARAGD
jgi:RNA polymerase sigma-70 factor (ECF subfamily)